MLNLEDDEPKLGEEDMPLNTKKQLNLELSSHDSDLPAEADRMKVYLRIRPFSSIELHTGEDQVCHNKRCLSQFVN